MGDKNERAFPMPAMSGVQLQSGMTLHDWYVGQALACINPEWSAQAIAREAFEIADQIMIERQERAKRAAER